MTPRGPMPSHCGLSMYLILSQTDPASNFKLYCPYSICLQIKYSFDITSKSCISHVSKKTIQKLLCLSYEAHYTKIVAEYK
jgi:hypothetical protein